MLRPFSRLLLSSLAVGALVAAQHPAADASGVTTTTTATSTRTARAALPAHTRRVVVRPVTAAGRPAPGYRVHRESGSISCEDQSQVGVDRGIDACYPTAYNVASCWKSGHHTVLCLRDVSKKRLVRIRYSGTFAVRHKVRRPSPQEVRLVGGGTCAIRVGGAWGEAPGHPSWVGFYSCTRGSIYGPATGDGIDRSHPVWRVHVLRNDGSIVTRPVATATYVGTRS